jgi:retron-type reverse transcriptase
VEIPKGNGKVRKLGIPAVRDRVVQQAISKATMFMRKYELNQVVDMDLSKCFDTLDHELIIKFMRKRVTDDNAMGTQAAQSDTA